MKTIILREWGILPKTDITLALYKLFIENPQDTEFVFEADEYYFSPHEEMRYDYRVSNSDPQPYRTLALWLKGMKNCVLRGCGAKFLLEGHMQVFTLDECENVTLDGFYVDWKYPLAAEGKVLSCDEVGAEIFVDPDTFPHRIADNTFEFYVGAGEWYKSTNNAIAFESEKFTVRKNTGDIYYNSVTPLGNSVYRLEFKEPKKLVAGDLLNIRHNVRIHAGVFCERCRDITVKNTTFYSCGGLGCLAQFCHNLTYQSVDFLPNNQCGRFVSSGRDDGMHITNVSGHVVIKDCKFHALMDDPINVHSCCVILSEVIDNKTVLCTYGHRQACGFHYWAKQGDDIVFIKRGNMSGACHVKANEYKLQTDKTFILTFEEEIPDEILDAINSGEEFALDNLTNTASFECTGNYFGSCRARGLLISTPKKVLIKGNYFESSGSAILVAGDSNGWFESGECHDVEITENTFGKECMSSMYQFCNGVISICPVVPKPETEQPYHKNIKIHKNKFTVSDQTVIYAYSCKNLEFYDNEIVRDNTDCAVADVILSYCVDANIKGEILVDGKQTPLKIEASNCR